MKRIYLDHNATTPVDPLVAQRVHETLLQGPLNPASQHQSGRVARRLLEDSRERISQRLGLRLAPPNREDRLVLTSGGTESNNSLLHSFAKLPDARIVLSAIEHPSILRCAESLGLSGVSIEYCSANSDGTIDLDNLDELTSRPTSLVSIMMANNETGVIQPVAEAAELCESRSIPFHTDASQVVGKLPIDFAELKLSAMTVVAHKFHGPVGIGALAIHRDLETTPLLYGGFQQLGRRPGTESVALTVGMAEALDMSIARQSSEAERLSELRDEFESLLCAAIPDIEIHGQNASRLPHVSSISFPDVDGQELFVALDMLGIDCSTGSACASGSAEVSPVLLAMGVSKETAARSLRFSFGCLNEAADARIAADRIIKHFKHLQH